MPHDSNVQSRFSELTCHMKSQNVPNLLLWPTNKQSCQLPIILYKLHENVNISIISSLKSPIHFVLYIPQKKIYVPSANWPN